MNKDELKEYFEKVLGFHGWQLKQIPMTAEQYQNLTDNLHSMEESFRKLKRLAK